MVVAVVDDTGWRVSLPFAVVEDEEDEEEEPTDKRPHSSPAIVTVHVGVGRNKGSEVLMIFPLRTRFSFAFFLLVGMFFCFFSLLWWVTIIFFFCVCVVIVLTVVFLHKVFFFFFVRMQRSIKKKKKIVWVWYFIFQVYMG